MLSPFLLLLVLRLRAGKTPFFARVLSSQNNKKTPIFLCICAFFSQNSAIFGGFRAFSPARTGKILQLFNVNHYVVAGNFLSA
ncbi:MAG: hypothetical protein HY394_00775 [Candidatus Diapherotrites archaeon]|nr:hypothetical protein [Candidatus Diapherotrites archaeon]